MDKKIEDFKNYYLNTPPPMEASEGFADVLLRLEKKKSGFHMRRYLFAGIALLIVAASATVLLFPKNEVTSAVKTAANSLYQTIFPSPSPSTDTIETIKIKENPSATPAVTEKRQEIGKEEATPEAHIPESKKDQNRSNGDNKVKGIEDQQNSNNRPVRNENNSSSPGNSGEHRNDNSNNKPNEAAKDTPASGKSNNGKGGKNK